jgi:hypothetical protein
MFVWCFLIIGAVLLTIGILGDKVWDWYGDGLGCKILGALSLIAFGIMLLVVLITNHRPEVSLQNKVEYYNGLNYKIESGLYKDELDILDKDIVGEIINWNTDINYGKAMQYDFWFGNFTPDIYDDLQVIDYNIVQ